MSNHKLFLWVPKNAKKIYLIIHQTKFFQNKMTCPEGGPRDGSLDLLAFIFLLWISGIQSFNFLVTLRGITCFANSPQGLSCIIMIIQNQALSSECLSWEILSVKESKKFGSIWMRVVITQVIITLSTSFMLLVREQRGNWFKHHKRREGYLH